MLVVFSSFVYEGRRANGRSENGVIAAAAAKLVVNRLLKNGFVEAHVFTGSERREVGGISQARKGAKRTQWWEEP